MSSTPTNTLGVERRASFAPTTPKRLSMTDVSSAMKNRRVDDESDIEKKYSFGEVLGQGAFGVVREVTNRQTHQQLAMKIVHKDKVHIINMCSHCVTSLKHHERYRFGVGVFVFSNLPGIFIMYTHLRT